MARLSPGSIFAGQFRVVQPLGRGGMGEVYVVEQASTGALRALKLLLPHLADEPGARDRFEREAKVAARVASDHLVQVIAAGVDDESGAPWLAMELLEGESLAARVARAGPLPPAEARELFAQLGHALGAAHDAGVVHRDLKPENLHVGVRRRASERCSLKVLDFGLAKFVLEGESSRTGPMGTVAWMAPEQTERGSVGPPADVWSVGLLAFWALVGQPYWRSAREASSVPVLMREILVDPIAPANERAAELQGALPPGFDAWFARAVVRDPDARFGDGRQACEALVALLPDDAGAVNLRALLGVAPTEASDAVRSAVKRAGIERTTRAASRKRGVAATLLFVVVAAAFALATITWRRLARDRGAATAAVPSASAARGVAAVSIVALPKPRCANEQALALYATALQAMRDANWSRAAEHLRAAAALEPTCAMIQLRLAQATDGAEQAASYARAVDGRTQMSPRDRALLEIWGAFLQTPPDVARAVARMQEAVKAFPGDAELFDHLCARAPGAEIAAAACKKATELDPDYADAWSDLGAHLHSLGRDDEALRAYERCVGLSPATSECQSGRAAIYAERGACAAAERDRRAVAEANPRSYSAHYAWAVSLDAIDAPREAVHVALHEAIALLPDDERAFNARLAEANAAIDDDDDETAERKLAEAERALGEHPTPENREHVALARVVAALDAGRFKAAGEIAAAFQARWPGWAGARTSWSEPALDYARFRAGAIDRPALEVARADWDARIRRDAPEMHTAWQRWMITYYGMIDDPEDAERALAAAPHDRVTTPFSRLRVADEEAIAGHAARALRAFEATDASCPVRRALRRSVERGLAFEQTGARAEACALYARMTSATHAGKAPATLRGKVAAEHAKKLGCK